MKNILIYLFLILCLFSCKTLEYSGMTNDGDTLYYNGVLCGKITNLEYEYYRGKKVVEISIEQYSIGFDEVTIKMVDYILSKHPDAKVEIKPSLSQ